MAQVVSELALNGGPKAVPYKLPTVGDASGRFIGEEEVELVAEVIRSGSLFCYNGTKVHEFEAAFSAHFGVRHAVAVSSGTAALHAAVIAIDPEPGDEIVVAPITDMGTIIPILYQTAIPVFADVDPLTFNVTADSIARCIGPRTRAIMVVHLFGNPCDMGPIMDLARRHNLPVIEDCSQAHMAEHEGQIVGTIGAIGCFSFQQSKHMTTGDGGMTITNDEQYGWRARLGADKGWPRGGQFRDHLFLGTNYRMTELQGAVGIAQLRKLNRVVELRRAWAGMLTGLLGDIEGITPPVERPGTRHTYWQYPILVDLDRSRGSLEEIAAALRAEGIGASAGYTREPIYLYPVLHDAVTHGKSGFPLSLPERRPETQYRRGLCPEAEWALGHMLVLGINEKYDEQIVADISTGIHKVMGHFLR